MLLRVIFKYLNSIIVRETLYIMLYVICLKICNSFRYLLTRFYRPWRDQKMENYQLNWSPKSTFMYFSRVWERDSNWSFTNSIIENELYQLHLKRFLRTIADWLMFLDASVFRNFLKKNESTTKTKFWNHGKESFWRNFPPKSS